MPPKKNDLLQAQLEELKLKVESLENKVESLEVKVECLGNSLTQTEATLAISQQTSTMLKRELDSLQQYSRRNCIVVDGIASSKQASPTSHVEKVKNLLTREFPDDDEIHSCFDKAHPIGPVLNNTQSYIIRFSKHSVVRKIYNKRKELKNKQIKLRPSLTKNRSNTLKECNDIIKSSFSSAVNFVFADVEGNLKVCLKNRFYGKNIHPITDKDSLCDLIMLSDNINDYPDSDHESDHEPESESLRS